MLKKENRLARVEKKVGSSFFSSPFFNIRVSKNNEGKVRFGIVVSKKVSKKAVLRNKTKRAVRDIVSQNLDKLSNNKDIIIVSKTILNKQLKKEAEQELKELFLKAKIIK